MHLSMSCPTLPHGARVGQYRGLAWGFMQMPLYWALISVQIPQGVWNNSARMNINKHPHLLQVRPLLPKNVCSGSNIMSSNSYLIASFRLS